MLKTPLCYNCKNNCTVKYIFEKKRELKNYDYCKKKDKIVNIGNYYDKCDSYKETKEDSKQKELEIDREKAKKLLNNCEENASIFKMYEIE